MIYILKYSLNHTESEINLVDYGYSEETTFEELTEDQQDDITDGLRMENVPSIKNIKLKN